MNCNFQTFVLSNTRCKYILTERFRQDPLENYFGRQRSLGARKDNPTLRDVGFNDNSIRNQKVFRPISAGNCIDEASIEISDEKAPCRKKFRGEKSKSDYFEEFQHKVFPAVYIFIIF